ncbi:MAG: type II toxin-antitoxin system HicB family antitoxin, partial [Candidatus Acetothermia bacterium]|nr:type II toxin-antitoxin system HicB family antitoxin [Candidatus Acetothermia bacterium]
MRQVVLYPGEDGYWVAECPSLPGCLSQGKTKEEAIVNIKEAIAAYIAALEEDHLPVPPESLLSKPTNPDDRRTRKGATAA